MEGRAKNFIKSLYGVQIQKEINEPYHCKSEIWIYWKLSNGTYNGKMKKNDELDDDCDNKNVSSSLLGAFILSNSKTILTNFITEIDAFYNTNL